MRERNTSMLNNNSCETLLSLGRQGLWR